MNWRYPTCIIIITGALVKYTSGGNAKVKILPTASRRERGCVAKEWVAPTAPVAVRRTDQPPAPPPPCLLNLLLQARTSGETAGRNLIQEAAGRPHLPVCRDPRNTSAQRPNSLLQKATPHWHFGAVTGVMIRIVVTRDATCYNSDHNTC
jgi:hypothetical protein